MIIENYCDGRTKYAFCNLRGALFSERKLSRLAVVFEELNREANIIGKSNDQRSLRIIGIDMGTRPIGATKLRPGSALAR